MPIATVLRQSAAAVMRSLAGVAGRGARSAGGGPSCGGGRLCRCPPRLDRRGRQGRREEAASGGAAPLNVVFIVSDDENISGNAVMPNVQHLLADTASPSTNYHVTTSECGPSRASDPHRPVLAPHRGHRQLRAARVSRLRRSTDLAVWLHDAGYKTALVGKYINDYSLDGHNAIPPGWDDWQAMDSVPLEKYYDYT